MDQREKWRRIGAAGGRRQQHRAGGRTGVRGSATCRRRAGPTWSGVVSRASSHPPTIRAVDGGVEQTIRGLLHLYPGATTSTRGVFSGRRLGESGFGPKFKCGVEHKLSSICLAVGTEYIVLTGGLHTVSAVPVVGY